MPISVAKRKLSEVVRDSDNGDVLLMRHGHLEDLEDRLSVYDREGITVDLEKLGVGLGLEWPR